MNRNLTPSAAAILVSIATVLENAYAKPVWVPDEHLAKRAESSSDANAQHTSNAEKATGKERIWIFLDEVLKFIL